jgi:predicted acetyltransferase
MPEIRRVREEEYDECLAMSEYAFHYEVPADQREEKKNELTKHEIWGDFDGDRLLAKLHLLSLQVQLGGKPCSMGGIAGVVTWPENRRTGSVSRLIKQALISMKEQSQAVSYLHPFEIGFYRRFGWELTFSYKKYFIETKDLRVSKTRTGSVVRLDLKDNVEILNSIYGAYIKKYNGMLLRSDDWWKKRVHSDKLQTAVYYGEDQQPTGYVLYKLNAESMDVEEYIYTNEEARKGLWNFICQHDSMVQKVKVIAPENDQLPFLLDNPRFQQEIVPYFMGRIVDLKLFLEQYQFNELDEPLVFHVTDDFAEWNNGTYIIREGQVEQLAELDEADQARNGLHLDIQTMTAMLFGYQRPLFLHECGKLKGSQEQAEKLEQILPRSNPSFLDFF